MKPPAAIALLASLAALATPGVARADRPLDRVLADNPELALLARRLDRVHLELATCNWFGANDVRECARHMDAHDITRLLERVRTPAAHEHAYCISYNRPFLADRGFRPVSGFKCFFATEAATETLELACGGAAPATCTLHDGASNDDEDTDMLYEFRVTGRGASMAIEDDAVRFSFAHTN